MGFLSDVLSEMVGNSVDGGTDSPSDAPYVHPPWVARWDGEAGRWIYFNEETGERSWEKPVLEEAAEAWDREEDRMERRFDDGVEHVEEFPEDAARWTGEAVGEVEAVPDRVEEGWDRAEENIEEGWDRAEENVEEGWERAEENVEEGWDRTGEHIEEGWNDTVDAVENAPENIAEGIGEGVGEVERFGDSVEDYGEMLEESYENGRDEARYD
ncbi:hypothetical protein DHEL01_v207169 [Diaporthe helianthi]|uniref:WW domain-containing protein n=1 Tax=Diaporthe helianthi TaxID=158607 RepID=A0A2P5HW44_DIAHE|nr:hypothetical protein DHEL01_v207169 [Diaporthe helianthi]